MEGYGRGSKKLGVPTANLPHFHSKFASGQYPTGVYFGWASIKSDIYPMVTNVGRSPTFIGQVSVPYLYVIYF